MRFSESSLLESTGGDWPRGDDSPEYQRPSELQRLHHVEPDEAAETIEHRSDTDDRESHVHKSRGDRNVRDHERAHRELRGGFQLHQRVALSRDERNDRAPRQIERLRKGDDVEYRQQRAAKRRDVLELRQLPVHRDHRFQVRAAETGSGVHPGRRDDREEQRLHEREHESSGEERRHDKRYLCGRQEYLETRVQVHQQHR